MWLQLAILTKKPEKVYEDAKHFISTTHFTEKTSENFNKMRNFSSIFRPMNFGSITNLNDLKESGQTSFGYYYYCYIHIHLEIKRSFVQKIMNCNIKTFSTKSSGRNLQLTVY